MLTDDRVNRSASASDGDRVLNAASGVLRMAPTWVPRSFCVPGRRIRLHPDDYFAMGGERGGIDERWFSSTVRADNGPLTGAYEGVSLVVDPGGGLLPFDEVVNHTGAQLIGSRTWDEHGDWPMYSKFFDNDGPLPLHVHHRDEDAALVGKKGKPEAYYFPPQMNNHSGELFLSFFGLHPEVTRDELAARLAGFPGMGDNRITELSRGFRVRVGTGWDVPAGVLHAPASVCTYEPQSASDVFCMCESWSNHQTLDGGLMWKDVPVDRHGDIDFILGLLDWEANTDPAFLAHRFMVPRETSRSLAEGEGRYREEWIVYRSPSFSAKQLTVPPGADVVIRDSDAYGCIVVQGHGLFGDHVAEAATLVRFGQLTSDEFFVSGERAQDGVRVRNDSITEPLVILKHFAPGNPEMDDDHTQLAAEARL
jgi:hypothetical protein